MRQSQFTVLSMEMLRKLLATNQLAAAFRLLDQHIIDIGLDTDHHLMEMFVSLSAHYHRTEHAFRLGTLPWDTYNLASNQVIQRILALASSICAFRQQEAHLAEVSANQDIATTGLLTSAHISPPEKTEILTKRELIRTNIIKLLEEVSNAQQRK